MVDRRKYREIAEEIRDRIVRGELVAGQAIPSVAAIRERHDVSVTTAQAAVDLLKGWGLVTSTQGKGTYVASIRPVVNWMTEMTLPAQDGSRRTWRQIAADFGQVGTQRVLGAGTVSAPPDVADALDYDDGVTVTWRERLMLADGKPVQIATSYYPEVVAEVVPELVDPARLLPKNAMELIARAGYAITNGDDLVFARLATADEAAKLEIKLNAPVSEVFRTARSAHGAVVTVERMVSNSARMRHRWKFS